MMRRIQNGLAYAAVALAMVVFSTTGHAESAWQVESRSGDVWIAQDGATPVALGTKQALTSGTMLTTGATGRVIIRRGEEAIVVAPNTSIQLAPQSRQGLATTIIQSIGTILLSVDKKDHQHFEVETPYLAAVVKGTKFAVTVAGGKSSVHVVQGAVEVMDFESGDVGMVRPGQTADVSAGSGVGLSVSGPGAASPAKALRTGRVSRAVAPATRAASPGSPAPAMDTPKSQAPVRIKSTMGVQRLDVPAATRGLIRQSVPGTAADAVKKNVSAAVKANDNAGAKTNAKANGKANGLVNSAGLQSAASGGGKSLGLGLSNSKANGNGGGLALGASTGNAGGNGGGLALGASTGNAGGNGGGLALGASTGNAGGNGGGLALGTSTGNAGGNVGGLALGASTGNAGGNGGGLALGASTGNAGGNGGGLALGASTGNAGGNGNGLALGASNGNNGHNGNGAGNSNPSATGNGSAKGKSKG